VPSVTPIVFARAALRIPAATAETGVVERSGPTIPPMGGGQVGYVGLGEDEVAYSVSGSGPIDLLHIPGLLNHIESAAEEPTLARHYAQLASFSRFVAYDRRGSGLSSPLRGDHPLTLEERADEALAVLDAVGIERSAVYSTADGVPVALMLAAMHPERLSALALYGGTARMLTAAGYLEGWDPSLMAQAEDVSFSVWGDDADLTQSALIVPSRYGDPAIVRSVARMQRRAGTPLAARRFWDLFLAMDVRELLESIAIPTLVLHCSGDLLFPVAQGRYLASHIRDAKFVELTGTDHYYLGAWG
jgi:pimeloyl-ACP methyl ester carboxylesterase